MIVIIIITCIIITTTTCIIVVVIIVVVVVIIIIIITIIVIIIITCIIITTTTCIIVVVVIVVVVVVVSIIINIFVLAPVELQGKVQKLTLHARSKGQVITMDADPRNTSLVLKNLVPNVNYTIKLTVVIFGGATITSKPAVGRTSDGGLRHQYIQGQI